MPSLRPLPFVVLVATLLAEVAAIALSWGLEPYWDTVLYAVAGVVLAAAGALVATRHPGHSVGRLFLGGAVYTALLSDLAQGYGLRGAVGGWPGADLAQWCVSWSWLGSSLLWTLTLLLLPDGRFSSGRWRWVAWAAVVGQIVALPGWALSPARGVDLTSGRNPLAVKELPSGLLLGVGMPLVCGTLLLSVVAVVLRWRCARGEERVQLRLVVFAAALVGVTLPVTFVLWYVTPLAGVLAVLVITAFPLLLTAAMLRYRLYQIDTVVDRTAVYAALSASLGGVYLLVSVTVGTAVGRESGWATAAATLAVAVAFRPVRRVLQGLVDRAFHAERLHVTRRMEEFLDDLRSGRAAPEDVEPVLARLLGDPKLRVLLFLPESRHYVGLDGVRHSVVDVASHAAGDLPGAADGIGTVHGNVWPVTTNDHQVGVVLHDPGHDGDPTMVRALVSSAALALEVTRLRVELRLQLAQVQASRTRIVAAAHEERRRIERDLHDGAQQRLISIGLALRHAQHAVRDGAADEAWQTLEDSVAEVSAAVTELRELARGLPPAQLDAGLAPAFADLARRAPVPVSVSAPAERFDAQLEGTAWFVGCEGLTNAIKYSAARTILLSAERRDERLVVRVEDDGVGGAVPGTGTGLAGLADRVAALGGVLRLDSPRGRGTRLVVELPCAS